MPPGARILSDALVADRERLARLETAVAVGFAGLVAWLLERFRGDARALRLQAIEYERRLSDLNHAHQQAREAAAQTVPREIYDRDRETDRAARALAKTDSDTSSGKALGRRDLFALAGAVVALIVGVIVIANVLTG